MKIKVDWVIKVIISLFFIGLLGFLMRGDIKNLLSILKQAKLTYFIAGSSLFLLIMVILSLRLRKVMAVQEVYLPLKDITYLSMVGLFFNNFLPTSLAGDVVKAHYTAKYTAKTVESYTSILIDRIFGLISFVFIATFALIFADSSAKSPLVIKTILIMIICLIILIILITTDLLTKRFSKFIEKTEFPQINKKLFMLLTAVKRYKGNMRIILFALCISVIAQIISVFMVAVLAKGLSIDISLGLLFLTLPIITVISMLPSFNGLGIRESAYVFFLGKFVGNEQALAISILWLGAMLTISFVGGIVYFLRDILLRNPRNI